MTTIAEQYRNDDSAREDIQQKSRTCAAFTKPWILPPEDQQPNQDLPENYQSLGARGITNLEGRMLLALYPPGMPWFGLQLRSDLQQDPNLPDEEKQLVADRLYQLELQVQAILESQPVRSSMPRALPGFRSAKRDAISQILVTGETLEKVTDDYRIKVFRRDQYVTLRSSDKSVIYHIIKENMDPLSLDEQARINAGINDSELMQKMPHDRMADLYTMVSWQPLTKTWVIKQELNEKVIAEVEEPISPFISTPFELVAGENYGRGFAELNLGDLRSLDSLRESQLQFAAAASMHHPMIDENSRFRESDFDKPAGTPLRARVRDGRVTDIAMLQLDRLNDFTVVEATANSIRKDLGQAMLLEIEATPTGDRVTKFQVQRVAFELEVALGGVYAPISDEQQAPLVRRVMWQMSRDNLIPTVVEDVIEIDVLTGVQALSREIRQAKLLNFTQMINQYPAAAQFIDPHTYARVMERYSSLNEPKLVMSSEDVQRAQAAQLAQQAAQQAVTTAGEVAGQQAVQQQQQEITNAA